MAAQEIPGPAVAHRRRGPRRREGLPVRGGRQRPAPRGRPLRRRYGHGLQEPQGRCRERHQGRGQHQGPGCIHAGGQCRQEGSGRERGYRTGTAHLRHPGADERHQRGRRHADPQHARSAVRGRKQDFRRGHARTAGKRRQAQPGHQRGLFRLHHRLWAHLHHRPGPFLYREQAAILGRIGRPGIRSGLGAGFGHRGGRHRCADLRQFHLQRGRD